MNIIVEEAIRILEDSARYNPFTISSPDDTKKFLRLKLVWVVLKTSVIPANSAFHNHRLWRTSPFL